MARIYNEAVTTTQNKNKFISYLAQIRMRT